MDVEQQIENLYSIGLTIEDKDAAARFLSDVSYFRLIKAFGIGLKREGKFCEGTTFEQIKRLYLFNAKLRHVLFPEIEKTEINLRCRLANYFSCKYGVLGYKESVNFADESLHARFLQEINAETERNSKAAFVQHFRQNYEGGELPFYALIELFGYGMLSKFFKNLKTEDKKAIERYYDRTSYIYLESWFEHLSFVRNVCAHYGRLYNIRLTKTPKLYRQDMPNGAKNNKVYATFVCLKRLLPYDGHWIKFLDDVSSLLEEFPEAEPWRMGFPQNWRECL